MALKVLSHDAYTASNSPLRSADTGSGCRSSSSVRGGNLSGRMRCRKETGSTVSAPSHRSDTTRTKYCGGMGSCTGTVKVSVCSSSRKRPLSMKSSWCSTVSPSTSSTSTTNISVDPCTLSSHLKSAVMVSSILSTLRVMGCTCAVRSSLGNWWMSLWMVLPILGKRTSSPISCGDMSRYRSHCSTSFFSSLRMISSGIALNCRSGIMDPHMRLSIILHRLRQRSVSDAHPRRSTIS
mmetsp:Transcript_67494/g.180338  ORF Transcript_67494/g.180338 Transcript_67494/m.180338 type:complete len:237 (-) Transcript_67494:3335-4045(-)